MATKRLPTLPFLPQVPPQVTPQYASQLNIAINSFYRNVAASVDGMIITATSTADFPAAQGLKRFAFDGTSLYIDNSTTSWVPVGATAPSSKFVAGVTGANSSATSGTVSSSLFLFGGNNITLSNSIAGQAMSVTISGGAGGAGHSLAVSGNTSGVASTYTSGTVVLSAGNGITIGEGNQTLSILGNTVTVNTLVNSSMMIPDAQGFTTAASAGPGIGFPQFAPFQVQNSLAFSSLDVFFSVGQATAVGSSQAKFLTISAGIYKQAEPMTKLFQSSTGIAWTVTAGTLSGTSVKRAEMAWATSLPPGDYVLALWTSTSSSGNALAGTWSQIMATQGAFAFGGNLTATTSAASNQMVRFFAQATASSTTLVASFSASTLKGNSNFAAPFAVLRGVASV